MQAEAQRRLIAVEAQRIAHALQWVHSLERSWQRIKPFAWLAAPAGGFYLTRRGRSIWRWGLRLAKAWHWINGIGQDRPR